MLEAYLVWIFSSLFFLSFFLLIKKNYIFGVYYFGLYILTIFTQVVLAIHPSLLVTFFPDILHVEEKLFVEYWSFVFLSFLMIFILLYCKKSSDVESKKISEHDAVISPPNHNLPLFILVVFLYNFVTFFMYFYYDLSYHAADYPKIVAYGSVLGCGLLMVLYAKFRKFSRTKRTKRIFLFLFVLTFINYGLINIKGGLRSSIISIFIGILSYEIMLMKNYKKSNRIKHIIKLCLVYIFLVFFLIVINYLRQDITTLSASVLLNVISVSTFLEAISNFNILMQTYTIPSVLLLASIYHTYIDPAEVIKSNVMNSLILLEYPYLSTTVSMISNPSLNATRRMGYAYYFLNEGYNFMGWFGFIYNALFFCGGLLLWQKLFIRGNRSYAEFMTAVITTQLLGIIFGQSGLFIKFIYLFFLPTIFLFYLATGINPYRKQKRVYWDGGYNRLIA